MYSWIKKLGYTMPNIWLKWVEPWYVMYICISTTLCYFTVSSLFFHSKVSFGIFSICQPNIIIFILRHSATSCVVATELSLSDQPDPTYLYTKVEWYALCKTVSLNAPIDSWKSYVRPFRKRIRRTSQRTITCIWSWGFIEKLDFHWPDLLLVLIYGLEYS